MNITPIQVHCDNCGAVPGTECRTPSGKQTAPHQDRKANAQVIARHLRYASQAATA